MLPLSKQERLVIVFVCAVLLAGMSLRYLSGRFRFIYNFINIIAEDKVYPHVDVNRANKEELVNLPYVGERTALAILEHRRKHGPFESLEQVRLVKGLRGDTFQKIRKYLIVRK